MKNQLFFLLFLMTCFSVNSQNVEFSNPGLQTILVGQQYSAQDVNGNSLIIDANDDGEIQVSEALAVWSLNLFVHDLENLDGIEVFENLRNLWCGGGELTSLNLQGLQYLELLWCTDNQLGSLDVSNMTSLKEVNVSGNNLNRINVLGLPNLEKLLVSTNHLTSLDYSGAPNLKSLDIGGGNNFTSFTLTGLNQLETFTFDDMYEPATTVTIANLPNLTYLQMGLAKLQTLDLINLPALTTLILYNNPFASLDLSQCPNLENVNITDTDLIYLNIKNGPNIINSMYATGSNQLTMVCADEGEEDEIADQVMNSGLIEVDIVTTCLSSIEDLNTITGTMHFDIDTNGCGTTDPVMKWKKVNVSYGTSSKTVMTNNSGVYKYYGLTGDFTLTPLVNNNVISVSPLSSLITFTDIGNQNMQDFCITPVGIYNDVEIVIVPLEPARPGFDAYYKVIYRNIGNQMVSGTVDLAYDDVIVDLISSIPTPGSLSVGSLSWSFNDLIPDETREITLTFNVNGPMETPSINIGDILNYTVTISIPSEDETPFNNMCGIKQDVVGSLDPNDITCLEGETVDPEIIGEYLHYNINFENIGNAAATFVIVENDINPQEFDLSTLEILYASHDMTATLAGNKLTCRFDDINLGANEKGNIVYKVKTRDLLEVGDDVTQKANIFFDYNFPLATNEATTTFATLSTVKFEPGTSITVYPNPSSGIVNITADSDINSFELYDIQGRLLQSAIVNEASVKLDITQRASGMYFVKVKTEKGVKVEKILKN